jgi:hypothetical protein
MHVVARALPPLAREVPSSRGADLIVFLRSAGQCPCGARHPYATLFRGSRALAIGPVDRLVRMFQHRVKQFVAERARNRIFVHAGAVGWRDRMILLPGRSTAGKTRLVMALVRAGATYYSDEYAVIDRHGLVHAYPQPIGLRRRPGSLGQHDVPLSALGWVPGSVPLRVGLVVCTTYRHGARWRGTRLSRGQSMLELMLHTVQHARHPERVMAYLDRALGSAPVLRGTRGEAADASHDLLARISG